MEETAAPVKKEASVFEKHLQSFLLTIVTVLVIWIFSKVSMLSEGFARSEERSKSESEYMRNLQKQVNDINFEVTKLRLWQTQADETIKQYYQNAK